MKTGELHRLLGRVNRIHHKCSYKKLLKFGITQGQPRMLNYLINHDGCIQKELSDNCDLEPATVTNILAGMEKSELIRRESDPNDRRVLHVFLTEKGVQTRMKVEEVFAVLEEECFTGFSDEEKELSVLFLNRIYDNLKKADETTIND